MSSHAFLPPSGAHSWSKCAMWPTMNRQFPQEESAEASEGTAAHWVGWQLLKKQPCNAGDKAPNGVLVTEEMLEGGELLVDTIHQRAPLHRFTNPLVIEKTISIPIGTGNYGTPDCCAFSDDRKSIEIVDYKFGHRFVDEYWNPQGLCYLAGVVEVISNTLKMGPGMLDQFDVTVSFTVVQPRCFYKGSPVRTHTFKLAEARPYFNQLANMAEAAVMPQPTATTNEHCGDCPGRHACSALQIAAYSDAEYANARTPVILSPSAAALELRLLMRAQQRLDARVDGLKELTINNIRAGNNVPYFRVEQGYGRQQWNIPDGQIIAMGKMFGHDLSKPGTVTPAQAKKAGVDEEIIKTYSFTPATSLKLVTADTVDASKVFGSPAKEK